MMCVSASKMRYPARAIGGPPLDSPAPALSRSLSDSVGRLHVIEAQQLEHRHVLRGEEDGRLGSGVRVGVPGARRDHEEIPGLPREGLVVDGRRAPSLHHAIDRAAGLAMGAGPDARPQHLEIGGHGRTQGRAGGRIDVLEQDVVERIGLLLGASLERRVGVGPRKIDVAAGAPERRLPVVGIRLEREVLEEADDLPVEDVHPVDGRAALVAVVVPGHARGEHEVAGLHRALLAVDRREGALAVEHEPDRRRRVAVRRRHLAGQQVLDGEDETVSDGPLRHARVVQAKHPALGAAVRAEKLDALAQQRLDVAPAPVARLGRRRLRRDERPGPGPRGVESRGSQSGAVRLQLLDRSRRLDRHGRLVSSRARLGRRGPSPATPCGSHYGILPQRRREDAALAQALNTLLCRLSNSTPTVWPTSSVRPESTWARMRVPSSRVTWQSMMLPRKVTSATFPGTVPGAPAPDAGAVRRRLSGRTATWTACPTTAPGGSATAIGCAPPTATRLSSPDARSTRPGSRLTRPMKSATVLFAGRVYTRRGAPSCMISPPCMTAIRSDSAIASD